MTVPQVHVLHSFQQNQCTVKKGQKVKKMLNCKNKKHI
uniref:Uncharacterized protein n=1 Tax=Anguilla anguilla TaxID=7936 RepID=A0A0E9S9A0_ANGAN